VGAEWEQVAEFARGLDGRRPCFGGTELRQSAPAWRDNIIFSEYLHGDNGAAIGAAHQTGWTGLIADVIRRRRGQVRPVGDVIRSLGRGRQPWPPLRRCSPAEAERAFTGRSSYL
jgi:hypothetical protein